MEQPKLDPRLSTTFTIQLWEGIGYFLETESAQLGIYSIYWVPEARLGPILSEMMESTKDLTPLAGCRIYKHEDPGKDQKK